MPFPYTFTFYFEDFSGRIGRESVLKRVLVLIPRRKLYNTGDAKSLMRIIDYRSK